MLSTILIILVGLFLLLAAFVLVRMMLFSRGSGNDLLESPASLPAFAVDAKVVADHLSSLIKIETISHEDPALDDTSKFKVLHSTLAKQYPLAHAALKKEMIDGFSLLYTWKGSNESLDPVVLMAHQDVVPADEHTLSAMDACPLLRRNRRWFHLGTRHHGYQESNGCGVRSCGTPAVQQFPAERTVMLAFGHNEEILGSGAIGDCRHPQSKRHPCAERH